MSHARKRSEAGGDVQLFNLGATDSSRSSGAADSRAGGSRAGAHGCRVGEVVLRHGPPVDRPRAAAAGHIVDDSLLDPLGAAVDGTDELQPSFSLVCGPGNGRRGVGCEGVPPEPRAVRSGPMTSE